ncbi:NAD-dependent epimerase/dehydratase family protein, partial [bacterium]|nr:NAD-dependent epimerase/dehydratase family protein [bacterium]
MRNKTILVTGGGGYIGSLLVRELLARGARVRVYDTLFFGDKPLLSFQSNRDFQLIVGDMRAIENHFGILDDVDGVCHLASLSNDPSCDLRKELSVDINSKGTIKLARECKKRGIKRFVFMSSCSVYGAATEDIVNESSALNPVSLYAKTKIEAEQELFSIQDKDFMPTSLRQATVFGISPRMRFDLAINMMTMHAITKKEIFVMGGGAQWRPFIHVKDSVNTIIKILESPLDVVGKEIFNLGSNEMNYKIHDLALLVSSCFNDVEVQVTPDDADKRSYRVDFSKIEEKLGFVANYKPEYGVNEIKQAVEKHEISDFSDPMYYNILTMQKILKKPALVGGEPKRSTFLTLKPAFFVKEKIREIFDTDSDGYQERAINHQDDFENQIIEKLGIKRVFATKSYQIAIGLSFLDLNIKDNSRIIASPLISEDLMGLLSSLPVKVDFADLDESDYILKAEDIASKISNETKLVIANAPFTKKASLEKIFYICSEKNIPVLIDGFNGVILDITENNFDADILYVSSLKTLEIPEEINNGIISASKSQRYEDLKKMISRKKEKTLVTDSPLLTYFLKELNVSPINMLL